MENNDFIWLHLSVFYNRNEWQNLLTGCVLPLGEAMSPASPVDQWLIHLSHAQGENIRLSFRVKQEHAEHFLEHAHHSFKTFLMKYPSAPVVYKYPSKSLLADFPNNEVFYNLHRSSWFYADWITAMDMHALQHQFSHVLVGAFQNESFDDDTIFSFATHTVMGLLWGYEQAYGDLFFLAPTIRQQIRNRLVSGISMHDDDSTQGMMGFIEIAEDIFNKNSDDPEVPLWIHEWKLFCRNWFTKHEKRIANSDIPDAIELMTKQLLSQLGISLGNADVLFCMIVDTICSLKLSRSAS